MYAPRPPTLDRDPPTHPLRIGRRAGRRRTRAIVLVAALLLAAAVPTWSIGAALTVPGSDSVAARLAEWGRDHGLGGIVTWLEGVQYQLNPPPVGGTPAGGIPHAAAPPQAPAVRRSTSLPAPPPLTPIAGGPALPGEGRWQTTATVHGLPAVRVAYLRPDSLHTSEVAGVMWIDPTLVKGRLHPGYQDPGGTWKAGTSLSPAQRPSTLAVFNGGFRLLTGDSHGGYYSEGRTAVPLVDGAASLVLRTDGTATVGTWNHEVRMTPNVASVRQNLVPLIDNGVVNPRCATGGPALWGATIGNSAYIDRSAFGITADGAEVYVAGRALSVCSLADLLHDAGVVRGMELDINPAWVSGAYFQTPSGRPTRAVRLYPDEKVGPQHYYLPSSRDWYSWTAR
jgi:hypothetical protein